MSINLVAIVAAAFVALSYFAWRQYLWASEKVPDADTCPYSLTDSFGGGHLLGASHQRDVRWLTEVFSRSAKRFPHLTALQIPCTGESLTFAELDGHAENIAAAVAPFLTGPDQVVAVAMSQDNWQIVASHLGILKAGGTVMFLDTTLPEALVTHMLNDAQPAVVLTRGEEKFRDLPTLDVLALPPAVARREPPSWMDDPTQRLATIFYTSGTTGMPKGVECPHAGYVNLALSYADYFDLTPGMDATSLTSSLGYDGSISEMYSAWVSGCTVVLVTKEELRSGPELVSLLRAAEVTVLFCPPVLLTTLTAEPEVDLPYPICRYVVPAGEAFPSALVDPWTRGRRQIINTYGPTEASTDTSRQSLRPGEAISIGSPFPNVTYVILEVGQLRPLPHGETGELCIGGVHVARGYRNLPEQTAAKFITHPRFGRLYRTGDKCRIDIDTQRVHFFGRIDAQLKVRGHRVEAQAVEDILHTQFSEIEAAVLDYQNETLVAFVSAPALGKNKICGVADAPAEWAGRVTAVLASQLPAPSVPSRIFLVENFVMKPVSGKIDRQCLPDLSHVLRAGAGPRGGANEITGGAPKIEDAALPGAKEPMNPACEEVLEICRTAFGTPLGLDDGFAEAGGHSILIARLAQKLQFAGWPVSVRALLSDCNTARKVAERPRLSQPAFETNRAQVKSTRTDFRRDEAMAELLPVGYFTALQALFAFLMVSPGLALFLCSFGLLEFKTVVSYVLSGSLSTFIIFGLCIYVLALAMPFASLLWVMVIKLFMGGHIYKNNLAPGVYPKWSRMHLRTWCIARLENMVLLQLAAMYRSAPIMSFVLRQLGATVGRNLQCAHAVELAGPLDLISIGSDVAIQTGAYIHTTRWSGQNLEVGPIRLESGCKIGMRAAIANNVTVGRGSWITPFTPIFSDVGSHEMWEGAPARLAGHCTALKRTTKSCRYAHPIWLTEILNLTMQFVTTFCLTVVPTSAILWFSRDLISGEMGEQSGTLYTAFVTGTYSNAMPLVEIAWHLTAFAFVTGWLSIVVTSLLSCLFVRLTATSANLHPSQGLGAALLLFRMKIMNGVQVLWTWTITGQYLRALAGMRLPRVGASECDVMFNLIPELASADSQVFWSNGCYTNMLDYSADHLILRRLDMPRNFFTGNNCVVEHGQFPSDFLVGVSTPVSDIRFRRQMRSRSGRPITVAGNPPVRFASASVEAESENQERPTFRLFLTRLMLFDFFSIGMLRVTEVLIFTILFISLLRFGSGSVAGAAIALLFTETALVVLSVVAKRLLVGNEWGSDHVTPFWSWRHFAYFFAQDCFFIWSRAILSFCAGTTLSNPILRWMGCDIGERTIVTGPMQCFDWNAVSFGNDCVINGVLQYHSFENMKLKVKRTRIHEGCSVTFGACVMGGAVIDRDTTVLPLCLVLKEMYLPTSVYEGSPAEPAGVSTQLLIPSSSVREHGRAKPELVTQAEENMEYARVAVSDDAG